MSDVVAVVQARAGSRRLPGKVLLDVGGRSLLALMLARLRPLGGHGIEVVVATSDEARDDAVAEEAARAGVAVVRGDEGDVLGRFGAVLADRSAHTVVRLTADCPLIDPGLVVRTLAHHRASGADYTSTTLVRTFPDGLDVEVVRRDALEAAAGEATDQAEREHVTPFVYRRPRRFGLAQVVGACPLGDERWTVDLASDLEVVRAAVAALPDPAGASWLEVLAVLGRRAPTAGLRAEPDGAVTHRQGQPYLRRWVLSEDGEPVGRATVSVDDGTGHLDLVVPSGRAAAARAAVVDRLRADLQVRTLQPPDQDESP